MENKIIKSLEKKFNSSIVDIKGWIYEAIDVIEDLGITKCEKVALEVTGGAFDAPTITKLDCDEKEFILAIARETMKKIIDKRN